MDPGTINRRDDALGTQNHAVLAGIQRMKCIVDLLLGELLHGLHAPGSKDFVGVVMVVLMVVATAGAVLIVLMVVMMVVMMLLIMIVTAAVVIFLVMVVATAVTLFFMVMVVATAVMLFFMVMVVVAAVMLVLMMMVATAMMLVLVGQFRGLYTLASHSGDQLFAGQLMPGRCDDGCLVIMLT